jgi:hypothetical protein
MALSISLNKGFSKFLEEKQYIWLSNVRVTGISFKRLMLTNKKSIYSKKSLFLKSAVEVTYLYDMPTVPSDWVDSHDLEGVEYLTPKEFTYISMLA